jgi:hypothetical protein
MDSKDREAEAEEVIGGRISKPVDVHTFDALHVAITPNSAHICKQQTWVIVK